MNKEQEPALVVIRQLRTYARVRFGPKDAG